MQQDSLTLMDGDGGAPRPAPRSGPPAEPEGVLTRLTRAVRPRLALVILVTLLVGVPGVLFAWERGRPRYVAEATVTVSPGYMKTLEEDTELRMQTARYRDFLQQQVYAIIKLDTLEQALVSMGDDAYYWRNPDESLTSAALALQEQLDVEALHGSFTVRVSLEGYVPDGLAPVVNAVVKAYLQDQSVIFREADQRLDGLDAIRTELEETLAGLIEEKAQLAESLGLASFDKNRANPYQVSLELSRTALAEARRELARNEAELEAYEASLPGLMAALSLPTPGESASFGPDSELDVLVARRNQLRAESVGLTPEHPATTAFAQQIADLDVEISAKLSAAMEEARDLAEQRGRAQTSVEHAGLRSDVEEARRVVAALEAEEAELTGNLGRILRQYERGLALEDEVLRHRGKLKDVLDRIDSIRIESGSPGYASLDSAARDPLVPTRGGRLKYLVVFLGLAVFAGFGAAVVVDASDRRIHRVETLEQGLDVPSVPWLMATTDERSRRFADDQLRRLALELQRRQEQGPRRIVVTSSRPEPAVKQFVLYLGQELSDLGLAVLTVDGDVLERGGGGEAGLVELLEGRGDVQPRQVEGQLDHVSLGQVNGHACLPAAQRLGDVLETLGGSYDVLVVSAPSLPLSSDAELLAAHADETLVLVKADVETLDDVRGCLQRLGGLDTRVTPVLHGVATRWDRARLGLLLDDFDRARRGRG